MALHYSKTEKTWTISSQGFGWLPGIYDSERAAKYAFRFSYECLERLEKVNHALITFEMLQEERKRMTSQIS